MNRPQPPTDQKGALLSCRAATDVSAGWRREFAQSRQVELNVVECVEPPHLMASIRCAGTHSIKLEA
jgi:hypothetical protein